MSVKLYKWSRFLFCGAIIFDKNVLKLRKSNTQKDVFNFFANSLFGQAERVELRASLDSAPFPFAPPTV